MDRRWWIPGNQSGCLEITLYSEKIQLPDIRIKDSKCLDGTFVHLDLVDSHNLQITIDFKSPQFSFITVLQLLGMDTKTAFITSKKIMEKKNAIEEIEKRNFEINDFKEAMKILKVSLD